MNGLSTGGALEVPRDVDAYRSGVVARVEATLLTIEAAAKSTHG